MRRLVYRPKVWAYVKAMNGGFPIDLSPYIVKGSVERVVNDASTASITVRNPDFQFTKDQTFHPMDPITIFMARNVDYPVRVFTGFLDTTPYVQLFPGTVTLSASCTIKRLKHTYWDVSMPFTQYFLLEYDWLQRLDGTMTNQGAESHYLKPKVDSETKRSKGDKLNDSGLSNLISATMQAVGNWDPNDLLIEPLPKTLTDDIDKLWLRGKEERDETDAALKEFMKKAIGDPPVEVAGGSGGGGEGDVPSGGTQEGTLTKAELVALATKHKFPDPNLAAAVALAESGGTINNLGHNDGPPASDDLGLWQINDYYHPDWAGTQNIGSGVRSKSGKRYRLTSEPDYNAEAAYAISNHGTSWTPWYAYTGGNYKQYL